MSDKRALGNLAMTAIGVLMSSAMLLVGLILSYALASNLISMAQGRPHKPGYALVGFAYMLAAIVVYIAFLAIFDRLKRLDPQAYEQATNQKGFMARFWSSRGAPRVLYDALKSLDLTAYPRSFRQLVGFTLLFGRLFIAATLLLVLAIFITAAFAKLKG